MIADAAELRKRALLRTRALWGVAASVVLVQLTAMLGIHTLSLMLGQQGFYPIVLGGDDGRFHYAIAHYMLDTDRIGAHLSGIEITIWPSVMAWVMKLTGSDSVLLMKQLLFTGRLLDIAAAMIALEALRKAQPSWETPKATFWSRVAVLLLVGLYPSGVFYSFGSLYRDALIYAFHLLSVAFLAQAIADRRPYPRLVFLGLAAGSAFVLSELRQYAALSVLIGAGLWLVGRGIKRLSILLTRSSASRASFTGWTMALILLAGGAAAWYTPPIQQLIAFRDTYFMTPGGGNLGISFTGQNPLSASPYYAYSWVSNVIGPLPWQVHAASHAIDFILEVPLLAYLGFALWRRRAGLTPVATFLIVQAAVWFAMIAFSNDNLGTASRLRVLGWQCLFVVVCYLIPRVRTHREPALPMEMGTQPTY